MYRTYIYGDDDRSVDRMSLTLYFCYLHGTWKPNALWRNIRHKAVTARHQETLDGEDRQSKCPDVMPGIVVETVPRVKTR